MSNLKKISVVTALILTAVISTGCGVQGVDSLSSSEAESSKIQVTSDTAEEDTTTDAESNTEETTETNTDGKNNASSDEVVTDEEGNVIKFRTGTWASSTGDNYVFEADGHTGRVLHINVGTGMAFEYTLNGNSAAFLMDGVDFETTAAVSFSDNGNTANLSWSDGVAETIKFISERTDDDFSFVGEVEEPEFDDSYVHFGTGTWQSSAGQNYVFYEDGVGGKICNPYTGSGIPFEYGADDFSYVFHLGASDNNSYANVTFNNEGSAYIIWSNGDEEALTYMSTEIDDATAYSTFNF